MTYMRIRSTLGNCAVKNWYVSFVCLDFIGYNIQSSQQYVTVVSEIDLAVSQHFDATVQLGI